MKHVTFLFLGLFVLKTSFGQDVKKVTTITIKQISLNVNHPIPRLYIMRQVEDFRNSNDDSICLLTDEQSFDKLSQYILQNSTNKKLDKTLKYEYGCYQITLGSGNNEPVSYVIDSNPSSIVYFNKMREYIRLNDIDVNVSKKILLIIPNSRESGLR